MKSYKTVAFKLTVASPLVNVHMYNAPHVDRSLCASCPGTCLFCTCCPATRLGNEIENGSKNKEGEQRKKYEDVRVNGERETSVRPTVQTCSVTSNSICTHIHTCCGVTSPPCCIFSFCCRRYTQTTGSILHRSLLCTTYTLHFTH